MGRYCILSDVLGDDGVSGLEVTDISENLVNKAILDAESEIDRLTGNPVEINYERHFADGMTEIFTLDHTEGISEIVRLAHNGIVSLQPLPDDGSWTEENSADWAGTNATITDEDTIVKCRDYSIKVVGSSAGNAYYHKDKNLRLMVDNYTFLSLWIYSGSASVTFTVKVHRTDSDYLETTFTVPKSNTWIFISLPISDMIETGNMENASRSISKEVNWVDIAFDGAVTFYLEEICFTDKYAPVLGTGQFVWTDIDTRPSKGSLFEVSYEIDIFKVVPDDVKIAAACLASSTVWNWWGGKRYRKTGGVFRLDEGTGKTERYFSYESIIMRLRKQGLDKIQKYVSGPYMAWTEEEEEIYG